MRITLFGSGYVGLVTAACFAERGNQVVCVDNDAAKVARLKRGEIPIHEPGLEPLVKRNVQAGRIRFTTDAAEGIAHGQVLFIAVGTPQGEDGSADLRYVLAVARTIGAHLTEYKVIADKSTVPVGTADAVHAEIDKQLKKRKLKCDFDVVSNPEFLKEGAAVEDFMKPDRVIVGADREKPLKLMRALYAPFNRSHDKLLVMSVRSAELTKYAANTMLATKISLMNEIANIAEQVGADVEQVRVGIGSDSRIGFSFIYPGVGYGGSCFPKDVKALASTAHKSGYRPELIQAVDTVNMRQKSRFVAKVTDYFGGKLKGRTFALWGLAFKPNTDDMREAASLVVIDTLLKAGAQVQAYDPEAGIEARRVYASAKGFRVCSSALEATNGADGLIVVTEWSEFRSPDFDALKKRLKQPVIFDGRNLYEPEALREMGFEYFPVGRPPVRQLKSAAKRRGGRAV
ncbi:MAG: UDP-glucose/GDP-mannose dehydrogenase family protein [Pseudomonadota bacterium]